MGMNVMWIDGEYFEDQCETAKFARAMKIYIAMLDKIISVQTMLANTPPLFPRKLPPGEIITPCRHEPDEVVIPLDDIREKLGNVKIIIT